MPKTKKNPNPTPAFLQLDEGISAIFVEGEQIGTVHCWRETDLHQVEIWEITKPLSVFTDAATRSIEFQHADPKGQQGKTREGELLQGAATGVQPTFWHRRDLVYVGELPAPDPDDLGEVRWVLVDHGDGPQLSGAQQQRLRFARCD